MTKITPLTLDEDSPLGITVNVFGVRLRGAANRHLKDPISFLEKEGSWYVRANDPDGFITKQHGGCFEVVNRPLGKKLMTALKLQESTRFNLVEVDKFLYKICTNEVNEKAA